MAMAKASNSRECAPSSSAETNPRWTSWSSFSRAACRGAAGEETMKKPLLGLILGGVLGIFDGLSALVSAPEVAPEIVFIVIGSTFKGLIAGVTIGYFSHRVRSLPLGILFGLAI